MKVKQGRSTVVVEHGLDYLIGRRTWFSDLAHKQNRHPEDTLLSARRVAAIVVVAEMLKLSPGAEVHLLETLGELDSRTISAGTRYFPAERFLDLNEVHQREGSFTRTLTYCAKLTIARSW
ncbi:MAG: UTRA domain-containing protein [Alphaproteobacteria bacterium]|nr:UTRA domain-containing protein [Alphaproteobacteria bacterium]